MISSFQSSQYNFRAFFRQVSELEIFCFFFLILLGFIIDQKSNSKKPRKWFVKFNKLIIQRFLAVAAFYIPYLELLNIYLPPMEINYPFLVRTFLPHFIVESLELLQRLPFLHLFYLLGCYGILIRYKIPKDRFVRFNIMYSIIIISYESILGEFYYLFTQIKFLCPSNDVASVAALVIFVFWIIVFTNAFYRAILGIYPNNRFIREAIEVHLGRDGPDFIWWDRRKKA